MQHRILLSVTQFQSQRLLPERTSRAREVESSFSVVQCFLVYELEALVLDQHYSHNDDDR